MELVFTLVILLAVHYTATHLAKKIKVPVVVALMASGLALGTPPLKNLLIEPNTEFVFSLGNIALLCFMFLAGLESSWHAMYRERKDAIVLALFSTFVPFILGLGAMLLLGFPLLASVIVAVCMSITAEGTKERVLFELGKLRTKVGAAMMGAGIIDDILGMSVFIIIDRFLQEVYIAENLLLGAAIVSFFIGMIVQHNAGRRHKTTESIEKAMFWLVMPFFFISTGMHFSASSLIVNPLLAIVITSLAIAGKLFGALLAKPFTDFSWKQLHVIGWSMNSRGAVELALIFIAFRSGMLTVELYSSLIIMALLTTLVFPFIMTRMIKKEPSLMN